MTLAPPAAHPVLACAGTIERALDEVADVDPLFMSSSDKAEVLLTLTRLEARVGELRGRVLAAAADVAEADGARDPAAWLAHRARLDGASARLELRIARAGEVAPRVFRWQLK